MVGDGRSQDREEEQPFAPLLQQLICLVVVVFVLVVQREEDNMDHHIDQDEACQSHDVNGGIHAPTAPGGICADEAKQVEYHGCLQHVVLDQNLLLNLDNGHQGGHKGNRVAVEEGLVSPRIGREKDGVTGHVSVGVVLPKPSRWLQPRCVGDGGGKSGKQ